MSHFSNGTETEWEQRWHSLDSFKGTQSPHTPKWMGLHPSLLPSSLHKLPSSLLWLPLLVFPATKSPSAPSTRKGCSSPHTRNQALVLHFLTKCGTGMTALEHRPDHGGIFMKNKPLGFEGLESNGLFFVFFLSYYNVAHPDGDIFLLLSYSFLSFCISTLVLFIYLFILLIHLHLLSFSSSAPLPGFLPPPPLA